MSKRSDNITAGAERMPNRSLLRACGLTDEEMKKPIIGVVSAYSEIIPGHINLDKIADAAKAGCTHRRRYAGARSGYRRVRWHRHGPYRHEVFAAQP